MYVLCQNFVYVIYFCARSKGFIQIKRTFLDYNVPRELNETILWTWMGGPILWNVPSRFGMFDIEL